MIYSDCFSPSSFWPLSVLVFWSSLGSRMGVHSIGFFFLIHHLSLFCSSCRRLPPEETKRRLTGSHTCTSTRVWAHGGVRVLIHFAAFCCAWSCFFLSFLIVPRLLLLVSKSLQVTPFCCSSRDLQFLLRPS